MKQIPDPDKPVPETTHTPVQELATQVPASSLAYLHGCEAYTIQALRHRYLLQVQEGRLHPAHIALNRMERMLDVGCGIGEWIFDLAHRYPRLRIYGIDIDEEALQQATVRRNSGRLRQIEFRSLDILQPWPIPDTYFDFIHLGHCGTSLTTEQWPPMLRECLRVLKPGGWLNAVEMEFGSISSPAFMALHTAGREVAHDRNGIASRLYGMLLREQFDEVGYDLCTVDFGFPGGSTAQMLLIDMLRSIYMLKALIVQANLLSDQVFEALFKQAQAELQASRLCGWAMLISTYGKRQDM